MPFGIEVPSPQRAKSLRNLLRCHRRPSSGPPVPFTYSSIRSSHLIAVVAHFEERFVSGHAFRHAVSARNLRLALAAGAVGQASAAKAAYLRAIIGIAEAMP
jgi:hypothetical protein